MNSTPIIYYHRNSQPINSSFGRNRKKKPKETLAQTTGYNLWTQNGRRGRGQEKWRKRR